jgi:hypothetical protein
MKLFSVVLILASLILTGCASMSEPKLLQPLTKVALVSVWANDQLYYFGDQPPKASLLSSAMNVASNNGNNNALANTVLEKTDVLIAKADDALTAALGSARGMALTAKADLFASKAYAGAAEDNLNGLVLLKPVGYKFIQFGDTALASSLSKELGVNGMMTARFLFQKHIITGMMGTGSLGAMTTMTIQAFDANGKEVFVKSYLGESQKQILVASNLYNLVEYQELAADATQKAVSLFAADLAAR